jgi:hypothetical protein
LLRFAQRIPDDIVDIVDINIFQGLI